MIIVKESWKTVNLSAYTREEKEDEEKLLKELHILERDKRAKFRHLNQGYYSNSSKN